MTQPDAEHPTAFSGAEDGEALARDDASRKLFAMAETVARTPSTVLIHGETGVGKEVLARFIHLNSKVARGPMVAINCAALSASLIESELFGHEKGAFSGATGQHAGAFERAHGGTLLLDEVSELPLELQAKLLRVLQERQVLRVGGTRPIATDARIIATTNRDLAGHVSAGHFRQDLYFRLNVFPLEIPPLRERPDDILPLARHYATTLAGRLGLEPREFSAQALEQLAAYRYPGNVRELINIVERALILASTSACITTEHLIFEPGAAPALSSEGRSAPTSNDEHTVQFRAGDMPLTDVRRVIIERTLERFEGNRSRAAHELGVSTRTIRNKLKDYDKKN
ncbi:sigma-54-dependent Fis family transcriptional regulator [Lujinxingia vulgaris]|uniref:Sigma-54-dependent Fis family transcriptional regulator n=1 Tax=Lujinxingia vulgaris TaxID=2600176 RepID=A0A5C6X6L9_9DELT|nr:sigma-54 dependent transcriptional regulator [Lujinxingia vulgaris]TXD34395.1 sigma-54-dependent Fis family transcriptional regulator [Lujinxingia vulgaris]